MIVLYHSAMSTCSQKVRLALAEKGVEWTSHEVNLMAGEQKSEEYVALNPKGVVPTLVVDGEAISESTLINELIEEAFTGPALLPTDAIERARTRLWPKRIDEGVHAACGTLTFGTVMRGFQLTRPREDVMADLQAMDDPAHREARLSLFEHGVEAPEFSTAVQAMVRFFADMDTTLASKEWLGGSSFSLADCAAAPYALRFAQFGLIDDWSTERPNLLRWLGNLQARPSFVAAVTGWESPGAIRVFAAAGQQIRPLI